MGAKSYVCKSYRGKTGWGGGAFFPPPPPPILNRVKTKPVGVNSSIYFDFNKWNNKEGPIFKVGDHVKISKHQNIFAKGNFPNWSEEVFVIKKFKKTVPWTYVNSDLNGKEIAGVFYEKELHKAN